MFLARTLRSSTRSLHQLRSASTLVIAEHDGAALNGGSLSTISAAKKLGGDVTVLVTGSKAAGAAKAAASIDGVSSVLVAENAAYDHSVAENVSDLIADLQKSKSFTHILTPTSNTSKNFVPRVAALLDVAPLTDVMEVVDEETFKRPMYAGNAIATVKSSDAVKLMTIRTTSFEKAATSGGSAAVGDAGAGAGDVGLAKFVSEELSKSDRPELTSASVVISGGRGLKNGENFKMLEELADKLNGAVGASRAAVDAGFVPNELQIGQTGKVVAPDLYVAVGISGAIQHLAGMKDSKTIVAINKDEEAPIFQVSDYGLVADLFKAVPELTQKVK